jgi:hypothetical protein
LGYLCHPSSQEQGKSVKNIMWQEVDDQNLGASNYYFINAWHLVMAIHETNIVNLDE